MMSTAYPLRSFAHLVFCVYVSSATGMAWNIAVVVVAVALGGSILLVSSVPAGSEHYVQDDTIEHLRCYSLLLD